MFNLDQEIQNLSAEQKKLLEKLLKAQNNSTLSKLGQRKFAPIEPAPSQPYYPLSAAQRRLYILNQLENAPTTYNIPGATLIQGELVIQRLEAVLRALIKRHAAFRTVFTMVNGEPVQKILSEVDFAIEHFKASEEQIGQVTANFIRPFELEKAPLLRVGLIRLSVNRHILLFDMHHIISDGTSMGILLREFIDLYEGRVLPDLTLQYTDYAVWQNELLQLSVIASQGEYWLNQFAGEIPVLNLPIDFPRPSVQSFAGEHIEFELEAELAQKLNQLAVATGTTLYMLLLAALYVLLAKYSGQADIIIGSPIAGRNHVDLTKLIGMFVNTLAMRNLPAPEKTFVSFLAEVKAHTLQAFENHDYQFETLIEKLGLQRDQSRNPLFDVMFVLQNMDLSSRAMEYLEFTPYPVDHKTAKFDLLWNAIETGDTVRFILEYCTKLFQPETMRRMVGHWQTLLEAVTENPLCSIAELRIMPASEMDQLQQFNHTEITFYDDRTIQQRFERQAAQTPERTAVHFGNRRLTYQALNTQANQLARRLREAGVEAEQLVGIMVERSLEMVIGILAVLKAGGAFVPIDPDYPRERSNYILNDSGVKILLTQTPWIDRTDFAGMMVDLNDPHYYRGDGSNLGSQNHPGNLLYLIYTSGTTGRPKGAMLEQGNLLNLIDFEYHQTNLRFNKVLQFAAVSFDVCYQEIFSTLLAGGELYLINQELRNEVGQLFEFIQSRQIETIFLPTSYLKFLMKETQYLERMPSCIRHIVTAGEQLIITEGFRKYLKTSQVHLHNHYGPSETHVVTTLTIAPETEPVVDIPTIGKPIANVQIHILDKQGRQQPVGIPGEIYIAGRNTGRGYLNQPELTAAKFQADPFKPGLRMYRSGDLGRWLSDGNIEFLGRLDHQVKIRGFRIELGEIEAELLKHEAVKEAVVLAKQDNGGTQYLCGYVAGESDLSIQGLRQFLAKSLPDYMIPSYLVLLEKLPLNSHGKVDRNALPEPDGALRLDTVYEAPSNAVEEALVAIWSEILGVAAIGVNDNFFELGGHSLKAISLVAKIHKVFERELRLRDIFNHPTVKSLATQIGNEEYRGYLAIETIPDRASYPLAAAQLRLYLLNQLEQEKTSYNMPGAMLIEGGLDIERLETIFRSLIRRHEAFRTAFIMKTGEVVQTVLPEAELRLEYYQAIETEVDGLIHRFIRPFNLSQAPLLRVGLIQIHPKRQILLFDMHHIISDGTSLGILMQEFRQLYEGESLPELRVQYRDYAVWQNQQLASGIIKKQEQYWLQQFAGELPVLDLPIDYPRPTFMSYEGDSYCFELTAELTNDLKQIVLAAGTTLFNLLLASFNLLLARCTGQTDIIIGAPVVGRQHPDLERVIGIFLNTVALRNRPDPNLPFDQFLQAVTTNTIEAFENQDYQFEMLLDQLKIARDLGRTPLFDVMFNLLNMNDPGQEEQFAASIHCKPYHFNNMTAKFDLNFYIKEADGKLVIDNHYRSRLFKRSTIQYLMNEWERLLRQITFNPTRRLREYRFFDRKQLIAPANPVKPGQPFEEFPRLALQFSVVDRFEAQVASHPTHWAVKTDQCSLTYEELNRQANQVGQAVFKVVSQRIALLFDHDAAMISGMLGVLKAGKTYVPLDPTYPPERLVFMLEDAAVGAIVTNRRNLAMAEAFCNRMDRKLQVIDIDRLPITDRPNLKIAIPPEQLAYVLYTSGSTGNPKGVVQNHRNILHFIREYTNNLHLAATDRLTLFSSYSFDAAVMDIYGALLNGATLYPYRIKSDQGISSLAVWLKKEAITVFHSIPTVYRSFVATLTPAEEFPALRLIVMGGEAVVKNDVDLYKWHFGQDCIFVNGLGPTESTVTLQYFIDKKSELTATAVPVGYPVAETEVYLLNDQNEEAPVFRSGEIVYKSDYLALEYLNQPLKTQAVFGPDPLTGLGRVYRSGDQGRLLPDGSIQFMGRNDFQVKIRGYRIELSEVEAAFNQIPGVQTSVAVSWLKEDGVNELVAYYLSESGEALPREGLNEYLRRKLPGFMIPSFIIHLNELPVTPNGKIDRKALPQPEFQRAQLGLAAAPSTDLEARLVKIWADILGIPAANIGTQDDFFSLGGNSLSIIRVETELEKLQISIKYSDIYLYSTIKQLAAFIGKAANLPLPGLATVRPPLTSETAVDPMAERSATDQGLLTIPNIKPFNDFRYKSCFYNALFPVLNHFGQAVATVLINDMFVYNTDQAEASLSFGVEYVPSLTVEELLTENGLKLTVLQRSPAIIDDVVAALRQNQPVILWIDCYYESLREELYQKQHWPHSLLIYGFDVAAQTFQVLEHRHRDSLSYEPRVIGFGDVVNSYHGFLEHFHPATGGFTFYSFSADASHHSFDSIALRRQFAANLKQSAPKIAAGIECVRELQSELQILDPGNSSITAAMEQFLVVLNQVINTKQIEKYRLQALELTDLPSLDCLDALIDEWTQVRVKVARMVYAAHFIQNDLGWIRCRLDEIYRLEQQCFQELLNILVER